jgi:hypothetical protein
MLYQQTTYESCLAVALMHLLNIEPSEQKELEIWKHGWKFNYLIGQLNFISQTYGKPLKGYIENKYYFATLSTQAESNVHLVREKINTPLLDKILAENKKAIVLIDNYFLQKVVHAPHFVVIESSHKHEYQIFDPWEGKQKFLSKEILDKAIMSLKKRLRHSPVLIS